VNKPALHRIDLSIVKHHFAGADSLNVNRENCISPGFCTKDCSQVTGRSHRGKSLCSTAVNCNRHHAIAPRASRIVFAATLTQPCLHLEIFFLRHEFSLQTFSDPHPQIKQMNLRNLWIPVADGLRLSHQCLPFATRRARKQKFPRGST
jgi:hypothetical protein